jgi:GTP:adenosylcobinamide-phosphate guanylyltransferase
LVAAIILAGSRPEGDPVARSENLSAKALVDIGGATALDRVIDALQGAGLDRIVVAASAGPVADLAAARGLETIEPAAGPSESVSRAFDLLGAPLLVATADHPLLQSEWISRFLADAPADADVATMLASREKVEAAIPGSRRTWLKFSDGHWSGCNLFLLRTPNASRALQAWKQVERDRKRPWRIAQRIGPVTLARYALGMLSSEQAFTRLGRTMGVTAAVVPAHDGLAALDVDSVADLEMVRAIVAGREGFHSDTASSSSL